MLAVGEIASDDRLSSLLALGPNEQVVRRERRYRVDDKPVQLATSYLPARIAAGTRIAEQDTGPGGVYARLGELGFAPVRWVEELAARMPTPDEAKLLHLSVGSPVVTITRVAFTAEDLPVEVNEMTFDGGAYVFVYDILDS